MKIKIVGLSIVFILSCFLSINAQDNKWHFSFAYDAGLSNKFVYFNTNGFEFLSSTGFFYEKLETFALGQNLSFSIEYQLSEKILLISGLAYLNYQINFKEPTFSFFFEPDLIDPTNSYNLLNAKQTYLSIPLLIKYRFNPDKRFGIKGGILLSNLINKKIQSVNIFNGEISNYQGLLANENKYSTIVEFGLNWDFRLSQKLSWFLNPKFMVQTNRENNSSYEHKFVNFIGLGIGISL